MKKILKDNKWFCLMLVVYSIYYLYRMFAITPWYDELFTYLTFIDKGAWYSATHWPLPNNHVFFSVIASFFKFGGVYVGLRGVSWIAAIGTLVFLYAFLKRSLGLKIALAGVAWYTVLLATNKLAVQGRGYSLATFFLALAIFSAYMIISNNAKKRYYVCFSISLYLGLYTLMSSVYWVLPVCICSGIILILLRKIKECLKLIVASITSAGMTFASYSVLWISMGARQISSDPNTEYYQAKLWDIILKHPKTCLTLGFEYMMNDSNLKSIGDNGVFLHDFKYFARDTLRTFFYSSSINLWWIFLAIICLLLVIFAVAVAWNIKKKTMERATYLYAMTLSSVSFFVMFVILLVQCVYPPGRVFSFLGIWLAIMFAVMLYGIRAVLNKIPAYEKVRPYMFGVNIVLFVGSILCLVISPEHNKPYDNLDHYAYDAIQHVDWENYDTFAAIDAYSHQQVRYHCIFKEKYEIQGSLTEPDIIIMKHDLSIQQWSNMMNAEQIAAWGLEDRTIIYENEYYIVYR
ncbi:MAG: hypothetical protein IJX66_03955 [Lachnospiraceae bacterium]|nr:hypothetical protein [Lachnospiraceae bacterium]